jgi:hypothetical protein
MQASSLRFKRPDFAFVAALVFGLTAALPALAWSSGPMAWC